MGEKTGFSQQDRKALLRVAVRAAIARASDQQLEDARPRILAERLTKTSLRNAQIRSLENLAYTTDKVSDITDFLKKQIGRDARSHGWAKESVGREVIAVLESLRQKADEIVNDERAHAADLDADLPRRVHLDLCREFVKHLAAEFMYRKREA
ncbi:MAG: hypothetical protein HYY65_01115 [Candidatus Tectomicrobia bacterium]|uniref:Uncharacterized protein n=1 Tax=Tectimicrobiota bacterium TaxID=2528274 RepID=A0A932LZG1_UNCTE|nr:hypothetical protein [Candidatus Tectomicrobia bacterium]